MGADVVVVGGGIAGVSAAAALAEAGRRVVLVERAGVAAAASGRNSGVVQHPFDPVLVALHLATVEAYRGLAASGVGGFTVLSTPPSVPGLIPATSLRHPASATGSSSNNPRTIFKFEPLCHGPAVTIICLS